jgi:hypothetical protein
VLSALAGGAPALHESFDHVLRSEESLKEKVEYIRQNPVRRELAVRAEEPAAGGELEARVEIVV